MMESMAVQQKTDSAVPESTRLHYLDWLRVIAILGVFLYHAFHPFDLTDWHIKNAELSYPLTGFMLTFAPWGMPFFFLIAGTGTWFALRKRSGRQYVGERFKRLFIPFIFGCLLLTPVMLYVEWLHKTQTGMLHNSFGEFVASRGIPIGPEIFGWAGYHLWFLGFLFSFSLLALPLFLWLRQEAGQRLVSWLAKLCEHRGGILLAILPLLLVQLALRPFFYEGEHNWADFCFLMLFFILGYVLYADKRFTQAIRRDWRIILAVGVVALALTMVIVVFMDGFDQTSMPWLPGFYVMWTLIVVIAWCWTTFMLFVGMRFLDFSNAWLRYGQEAVLPFFVFHQPVIMVIAFFVVQWNAAIFPKLLLVVFSSFWVTVALYELVIRHINPLRAIFGMKPRQIDQSRPIQPLHSKR